MLFTGCSDNNNDLPPNGGEENITSGLIGSWMNEQQDTLLFINDVMLDYKPHITSSIPFLYAYSLVGDSITLILTYSSNLNDAKNYYFKYSEEQLEIHHFQNGGRNFYKRIKPDIILYDKSPDIIQHYIQGKWQLLYSKGGFIANNYIHYFDNSFVEFTSDNKYSGIGVEDSAPVQWDRVKSPYSTIDSVYIMTVNTSHGPSFLMDRISNDTLVYHQYYVSDPEFYHCVKIR
jgi:hypothetical protein